MFHVYPRVPDDYSSADDPANVAVIAEHNGPG
jgi:hypothetical protein